MKHPLLRRCTGLALATLAALLAACASAPGTPPAGVKPAVAPAWQAPLPAATTDLKDWWVRFNDPQLPALVAAAQAASPSLASAAARIEQARASRVAAGAVLLGPAVDAVGNLSHGRAQLAMPVTTTASLGLQASWELDLFGANAAGRDAAQARLEAAQTVWHGTRVAVAAELATSYAALRACEAQLVQSRMDADSRGETSRLTDLTMRAGFTAPADAALARASAAQARTLAVNQRAACDTLFKSLVELTAWPEPELRERLAAGTAVLPQPAPIAPPSLPAALLAQRPDLAEAGRQVAAAAADVGQARASELPQISLQGNLAAVGVRSAVSRNSGGVWTLGPLAVSFPLFDGGARAANTAAARAAYDEAVALYQAALRRALREVETSLVALQATAEREADARLAAQDFTASLSATAARQRGGLASLLDLENARRNAVQAQSALIELQRERVAAWIGLYRALGGGWQEQQVPAGAGGLARSATAGTP